MTIQNGTPGKIRILVIEDDEPLRSLTADLLEFSGVDVVTAEDGLKGLEEIRRSAPDLILCDLLMPELDGAGVRRALLNGEETRKIPFIFTSAKADRENIDQTLEIGPNNYLVKPFTKRELLACMALFLNQG